MIQSYLGARLDWLKANQRFLYPLIFIFTPPLAIPIALGFEWNAATQMLVGTYVFGVVIGITYGAIVFGKSKKKKKPKKARKSRN